MYRLKCGRSIRKVDQGFKRVASQMRAGACFFVEVVGPCGTKPFIPPLHLAVLKSSAKCFIRPELRLRLLKIC